MSKWNHICACGKPVLLRQRDSIQQQESRRYCSIACSNRNKNVKRSIKERFMDKVVMIPLAGCWLWTGADDGHGYGQININKKPMKAHRVSFQLFVGDPSKGVVRHICDNPACVNPEHLELGTQTDNMKDASRRGRINQTSFLNLRPGKAGFHGAGPVSNKEMQHA